MKEDDRYCKNCHNFTATCGCYEKEEGLKLPLTSL